MEAVKSSCGVIGIVYSDATRGTNVTNEVHMSEQSRDENDKYNIKA